MKFILIMLWASGSQHLTLQLGPFETEKLCVAAASQVWNKWKPRVSGDFLCIPTEYEREDK